VSVSEPGAAPQRPFADFRETFADTPLHRALGLSLVSAGGGAARVCMETSAMTLSGVGGSVHGGMLATMLDIAALGSLADVLEPGDGPAGTADLSITYLRPALAKRVYADATVVKKGRQLIVIEVSIVDDQGRLCAKGRALYALRRG
jgi:uncharacterized protein (TIGR00369 family)